MDNNLMPDTPGGELTSATVPLAIQIARFGERLAGLEARTSTEIGNVKDEIKAVRQSNHDIRNEIQKFIGSEHKFMLEMQSMNQQLAFHNSQLTKVIETVESLASSRNRVEGAWWVLLKITTVVGFTASGIAAAVTTVIWIFNNLALKVSH